mmetsp:Transcript_27373/g.74027  ORF Transcript_27373/g.74027 Transcript_27373/m.74027 type:complete len:93 (+) Transcript_27373:1256-1534(+)
MPMIFGQHTNMSRFNKPYTNHTVELQIVIEKGSGFRSPKAFVPLACWTAPNGLMYIKHDTVQPRTGTMPFSTTSEETTISSSLPRKHDDKHP